MQLQREPITDDLLHIYTCLYKTQGNQHIQNTQPYIFISKGVEYILLKFSFINLNL